MFISKANYVPKFVLQVFSQEISSHSPDLSYCMTFYLFPPFLSILLATKKFVKKFKMNINMNPVLALLQRGRVIWEASRIQSWSSLCRGSISVKPRFSQLWKREECILVKNGWSLSEQTKGKCLAHSWCSTFLLVFLLYTPICSVYPSWSPLLKTYSEPLAYFNSALSQLQRSNLWARSCRNTPTV